MNRMSGLLSVLFLAGLASGTAQAQGPVFNGVGAGDLIDFTTWSLYGDASASNFTPGNGFTYSLLSLTPPGNGGQAGAAFAPSTVMLDFNQSFTITFDFYMTPGLVAAGDGMTFVLTPDDPNTVNGGTPLVPSGGSDLGYGNSGLSGLAFAIDTFNFDGEPVAPSIQILENGSVTPLASTATGLVDIRDPSYFQWGTTLSYTPSGLNDTTGTLTGTIDQFVGGLSYSVSLSLSGAISGVHNVPLYYGFTAGNGLADDGHHVSSAVPVPEPATYAMLLAGLGLVGWRIRRLRG
ncbi:MAG: PEP-CTERM sorting domain-containing protein [Pseudomonadota bacterium]